MAKRLVKISWLVILALVIALSVARSVQGQTFTTETRANDSSTSNLVNDLILVILQHERELKLSPEQVKSLNSIHYEFRKQALRKSADLQLAELELQELQASTPVDPIAVEAKIKQS